MCVVAFPGLCVGRCQGVHCLVPERNCLSLLLSMPHTLIRTAQVGPLVTFLQQVTLHNIKYACLVDLTACHTLHGSFSCLSPSRPTPLTRCTQLPPTAAMASSQLLTIPDHELFNASELDDLEAHVQKQVRRQQI